MAGTSAKKPDKKPKVSPSEWNFVDDSQTGGPAPRKAAGVGFQMGCCALIVVALITAVFIIDLEEMSVVGKTVMQRYHEVRAGAHPPRICRSRSLCGHA
jgi:hypothetical protein